jgi:hypothetical protein
VGNYRDDPGQQKRLFNKSRENTYIINQSMILLVFIWLPKLLFDIDLIRQSAKAISDSSHQRRKSGPVASDERDDRSPFRDSQCPALKKAANKDRKLVDSGSPKTAVTTALNSIGNRCVAKAVHPRHSDSAHKPSLSGRDPGKIACESGIVDLAKAPYSIRAVKGPPGFPQLLWPMEPAQIRPCACSAAKPATLMPIL